MSGPGYRPEIDGLRALAVLAVVFYHVNFKPFSGGYVGVDVFFVISGFLITKLVYEAARSGRFHYKDFYLRRARRLLPAALLTLMATAVAATCMLAKDHLQAFGASLLSATVSASNVYFWSESSYFDVDANLKPLLHTWSLGVEEQFYLVWPACVVLLARLRPTRAALAVVLVTLLGFAAACLTMRDEAAAAFFLTPLRMWELTLGASIVWAAPVRLPNLAREALTVAGIAMIGWAVFSYDESTAFPGASALVPCAGAALALFAGDARYAGVLLRNRASAFIGKTSYSFYLIHWPVIVLYHYYTWAKFTGLEKCGLALVSFAGACLMWRYVEQPFRHPESTPRAVSPVRFGVSCVTASLATALAAAYLWTSGGFHGAPDPESEHILEYLIGQEKLKHELSRVGVCATGYRSSPRPKECLVVAPNKPNFLVLGDSYAEAAYGGMRLHFGDRVQLSLLSSARCRPSPTPKVEGRACREQTKYIFERLDPRPYDVFFLVGAIQKSSEVRELKQAAQVLSGRGARQIIVLGSPQSYLQSVTEMFKTFVTSPPAHVMRRLAPLVSSKYLDMDRTLAGANLAPARYVSMISVLCPQRRRSACVHALPSNGYPIMTDPTHISVRGAAWVFEQLDKRDPRWATELATADID